jgi:hypothetical protein
MGIKVNARWSEVDLAQHVARNPKALRKNPLAPLPLVSVPKISREVKHDYKAEFEQQLSFVGIQAEREFVFAPPRRWRSDWRVKDTRILIEFEGGLYAKRAAGHSSVTGIQRDIRKYNAAAIAGWIVIRITPEYIVKGYALKWVEDALKAIGANLTGMNRSLVGEGDHQLDG